MSNVEQLNPAQRRVLAELRGEGEERPSFDPGLGGHLRQRLENEISKMAAGLDKPLWASKAALSRVLSCESYHIGEEQAGFSWSTSTARGSVIHKAVQLSVGWKGPRNALELIDASIESLTRDNNSDLAWFLSECSAGELAELRAEASELVCKFLEQWPPLVPAWKPRSESRLRVELCDSKVILSGKTDLTLGTAKENTAGRLIVDFKTGRQSPHHIEDLRFYALLDTLIIGIPPFRLAGYYLDEAKFHPENVTEEVLEAALRRTVAGLTRLLELTLGLRSPQVTPNPTCGWCSLGNECSGAKEWADIRRESDDMSDVWED